MNFKEFKQLVKRADKTHIIERVYHSLLNFKNRREFKDRLKINLHGVKRNKKVYIVRRAAHNVGLFSYFITTLGGIAYADKNNMTPVVDLKNLLNTYLETDEVGKINMWEYYFMQPSNIILFHQQIFVHLYHVFYPHENHHYKHLYFYKSFFLFLQ